MKSNLFGRVVLCAAAMALVCGSFAGQAAAQDPSYQGGAANQGPKPKFVTLPPHQVAGAQQPAAPTVTNWSGSFMSGSQTFTFKMVGTDPSSTNVTTNVPVFVIPIKVICQGTTYDPATIQANGKSAITNTVTSPIFTSGIDFVQGGTDVGKTQYVDAYQRANFWTDVLANPSYHVLMSPVKAGPTQTLNVPNSSCSIGNPFGFGNVGIVNINYFDPQLTSIITAVHQITPSAFVIAMTYDIYLSENSGISGCCIGGYHSVFGGAQQTYSHFTYIPNTGQFSQDVSALSHEVGEWYDDPFVNNSTEVSGGCTGILENGDPLEGLTNFGSFPYSLHGFTYHLQDLVFLDYWSGNPSLQVNGWYTFQNEKHSKCS